MRKSRTKIQRAAPFAAFGAILQAARKAAGRSQEELAHSAGVTLSTYQKWEQGQVEPGVLKFGRVLRTLGSEAAAPVIQHITGGPPRGGERKPRQR